MATMSHHLLAKATTDAILHQFKTGAWTYGPGYGADFYRTGIPADFPSPDAAFYDPTNKKLAYFEFKPDTETKRGILTGVGQTIAYLQNSNLSYLIAPYKLAGFSLGGFLTDLYKNQLDGKLPTGLILYDNTSPSKVDLIQNVTTLTGAAATTRTVAVERFWAKHQDLPIPLFHLILHYYYLKKVGMISGDPFATCFSKSLISSSILSTFSLQKVKDIAGNIIKTVAKTKDIVFLEKLVNGSISLPPKDRYKKIAQQIDTSFVGDNYYNSIKKNYISFMKHLQMIDSTNELTEIGFAMYNLGITNGPTSKIFYDYFTKELLTTGHHLELLLDFDSMQRAKAGMAISAIIKEMEDDYEIKGAIKRNPHRKAGTKSNVSFLKYERILWKSLELIDKDDTVRWKKITEICSLPDLI